MVAYSFKQQFILPIATRRKYQTIRSVGKRHHAKPGETLQLYTAMRTKQCRMIATALCIRNDDIVLDFEIGMILVGAMKKGYRTELMETRYLDRFAHSDGFENFADMAAFWKKTHKAAQFEGRFIQWDPRTVKVAA